jgi:hypothetical protein
MNNLLEEFSKENKDKSRKIFQQEWNKWVVENKEIIQEEINRIRESGYTGNVLDKMFTSCRYYYRKKKPNAFPQPKRKQYEKISKLILQDMDNHIQDQIIMSCSPCKAFTNYTNQIQTLLRTTEEEIQNKIINKLKKTYKNRYHVKNKKQTI